MRKRAAMIRASGAGARHRFPSPAAFQGEEDPCRGNRSNQGPRQRGAFGVIAAAGGGTMARPVLDDQLRR
jgi:hypothetical protein